MWNDKEGTTKGAHRFVSLKGLNKSAINDNDDQVDFTERNINLKRIGIVLAGWEGAEKRDNFRIGGLYQLNTQRLVSETKKVM